jgi:hypothetical protein
MKGIKITVIIGEVLFLFCLNYYVLHLKDSSPQTSLNVLFGGAVFLFFGLCVFVIMIVNRGSINKRDNLILVIVVLSILISFNFFLFDYFNFMVQYDRWIQKGLPAKPFWF